jgi:hypothetical protein
LFVVVLTVCLVSAMSDAACLSDGPALYERVKSLRDPLLVLNQKQPKEMASAVATWRQLNQEIPKRINALRLAAAAAQNK